jgi:hypothetical protein
MLSEEATFRLFLLLVLIANHIATPFNLRAHFVRLFQDYQLLMREGEPNYAYNPFNLSWERLPSTKTFPTERGRRWGLWDVIVGSGNNRLRIQAYGRQTFSRSRLSLRQCSNKKNALMPLV